MREVGELGAFATDFCDEIHNWQSASSGELCHQTGLAHPAAPANGEVLPLSLPLDLTKARVEQLKVSPCGVRARQRGDCWQVGTVSLGRELQTV